MEQNNKIPRSEAWNNIYEVLARLDLKETTGDVMDRPSAATELEALFLKLLALQNVVRCPLCQCTKLTPRFDDTFSCNKCGVVFVG